MIEDARDIARLVDFSLRRAGFEVEVAATGAEGLECAAKRVPNLVLLDVSLPDIDGFEVCSRLRNTEGTESIGVLMVTAHGLPEDRVRGLECGADDYMTKPFDSRELVLRATAVVRRSPGQSRSVKPPPPPIRCGVFELELKTLEVRVSGRTVDLRPTEIKLLQVLLENPGITFSRRDLLLRVWNVSGPANERVVDVTMHRLRTALGKAASAIETVLDGGYRLRRDGAPTEPT